MKLTVLFRRFYKLSLLPFAILTILIVRILRPIVLIRFGEFASSRIGNFALFTEVYLCRRDAGRLEKGTFDIFYHISPISNYQMKKMWDRVLLVFPFPRLASLIVKINKWLPGYQSHLVPNKEGRDLFGLYASMPSHVYFTAKEEKYATPTLRNIGIPEGASFVCFHARDSAYLDITASYRDWSYHDYRDFSINDYALAAEKLTQRGYFALRMGSIVKEPLVVNNPMVIDYALRCRTDFLDIYLSAKCKFFIGCGSGIDEIPKLFRRPVVYVNFIPLDCVEVMNTVRLFIPKKLWSRKEKRFLSFREILDSGAGKFFFTKQYAACGLDIVDNTPEEIRDIALEMDDRIKGVWQGTEEDEDLQNCFWSLFKPSKLQVAISARIGAEFLRNNKALLN